MYQWDFDGLARQQFATLSRTGQDSLTVFMNAAVLVDPKAVASKIRVVVISPDFMRKRWAEYELRGLTTRELSGDGKVILPIWHGIGKSEIANYSPPLAATGRQGSYREGYSRFPPKVQTNYG